MQCGISSEPAENLPLGYLISYCTSLSVAWSNDSCLFLAVVLNNSSFCFIIVSNAVSELSHDFKGVMFFQNCVDLLRIDPGSSSEMCLMSFDVENQVIGVKVEEEGEGDPQPITFRTITTESEVSFMSLWWAFYRCVMEAGWTESHVTCLPIDCHSSQM